MAAVDFEWPELERSGLVDQIAASLRAGRSVVLSGEAGVGKTTVARQALTGDAAWVQCLDGLRSVPLAVLSLVDVDPPLDSVARAYTWLRNLAEQGAVLFVDDAQWLDDVSAGVIAQGIVNDGLRAVATLRSAHNLPVDLARAFASGASGPSDSIEVEALDRSMVEFALELALGGQPSEDTVDSFLARSAGNPLFLRELTLEALALGALARGAGSGWKLTDDLPVPVSLSALLSTRLGSLSGDAKDAVVTVVVAQRVSSRSVSGLFGSAAVDEALRHGWLVEDGADLSPGHPLLVDVVRRETSRFGRRQALSRLVDDVDVSEVDPSARLRWLLELDRGIDEDTLDAGYLSAASALDLDLAGRLARLSFERFPSVAHGLRVANDLHRQGLHAEACDLVGSLRDIAGTDDECALVASHLVRTQGPFGKMLGTHVGRPDVALESATWADEHLEGEPFARLVRAADAMSSEFGRTEALVSDLADHPITTVRYDALELMMADELESGRSDTMLAYAQAMRELASPYTEDRPVVFSPLHVTCYALSFQGEVGRALGLARENSKRARHSSSPVVRRDSAIIHAMLCANVGLIDEGIEQATLARLSSPAEDYRWRTASFYAGVLYAFAGRFPESEAFLDDTRVFTDSGGLERDDRDQIARLFVAEARRSGSGAPGLHTLAERTSGTDFTNVETMALAMLVRVGSASSDELDRLEALCGPDNAYHGWLCRAGRARLDADPDALVEVADEMEAAGNLIDALETLAAAIGLFQARGEQSRAQHLAKRHRAVHARCPGLRWPLAAIAVDAPDLTARERQIGELAALGWSNREIADELSLSVRTIENNLQRAYAKLGVNRRSALGAALGLEPA